MLGISFIGILNAQQLKKERKKSYDNQSFFKNLNNLFAQSQKHTLSLRVVYFIDYNSIKKMLFVSS